VTALPSEPQPQSDASHACRGGDGEVCASSSAPATQDEGPEAPTDASFDAPSQAITASASQLAAIFESMADGVVFFDADGRFVQANSAFRALLALDARPEYPSLPLRERWRLLKVRDDRGDPLAKDDWLPFRVLRGEVLTGPNAVDFSIRALNGREVPLNGSGAPVRDAEGRIVGGVVILREVTQWRMERHTQDALHALLAMAETLVLDLPTIDEHGVSGEVSGVSAAAVALRMADLTRAVLRSQRVEIVPIEPQGEALLAMAVSGPIPDAERQQWQANWPHRAQLQDFLPPEMIDSLHKGELIAIDRSQPPFNRWPNPLAWRSTLLVPMLLGVRLVGIMTLDHGPEPHRFAPDELALAKGVARLAALVLERDRLLREQEEARANVLALREANRRMDEFLGIATHELKTPVTSSSLVIELAAFRLDALRAKLNAESGVKTGACDGSTPDSRAPDGMVADELDALHALFERAEDSLSRLSRLVLDLLDVTRIRAGMLDLRLAPCELDAIVREAVEEQRQLTPERSIALSPATARRGRRPIAIHADADRIRQVVTNYLTNAVKYSPAERPVRVRLLIREGWARVLVRDEGLGLPPAERSRIWERFHRAPGVEVVSGGGVGLGLGLHICRTIIERHGGQIGVKSTQGVGSTFWFALPLPRADD
jgi:signal transduction histidine kinase